MQIRVGKVEVRIMKRDLNEGKGRSLGSRKSAIMGVLGRKQSCLLSGGDVRGFGIGCLTFKYFSNQDHWNTLLADSGEWSIMCKLVKRARKRLRVRERAFFWRLSDFLRLCHVPIST